MKKRWRCESTALFHTTDAGTVGVLSEKVFLEISQNSQENTCARASFLIELQAPGSACAFLKIEKKCPECPICVHIWLKFPFEIQF